MCIADTRAVPSWTPLALTIAGDVIGDADEFLSLLRVEPQIVGMNLHIASAASAFRSGGARRPARKRRSPAAAIIAALSVDSAMLGKKRRHLALLAVERQIGSKAAVGRHTACDADTLRRRTGARPRTRDRQASSTPRAESWRRYPRSAASVMRSGARLLALANDAQHRGLETAEAEVEIAFQVRRVAIGVRQPRARQRERLCRRQLGARRSMTGPPGYPRPSSLATLSYASPAASSRVRLRRSYWPGRSTK